MTQIFRYPHFSVPVSRMTVPGGLTLVVIERQTRFAKAEVCLDVGSLDDGGHPGISHLLEHLVFEGPARDGVHPKLHDLVLNGVEGGAATSLESTRYWVKGLDEELKPLIIALLSIVFSADFSAEALEGEKGPVIAEIQKFEVRDSYGDWRFKRLYPATAALHHGNAGTPDSVRGMGLSDIVTHYRRHYRPENAALIVSSRFCPELVAATVASCLLKIGGFESGARVIRPLISPTVFVDEHRSGHMGDFMQWVFPAADDVGSSIPLRLALETLCDWPFGTIHAALRGRHSLIYSIERGLTPAPLPVSEITISVDRSNFEAVETLFREGLEQMAGKGPPERVFKTALAHRRRFFLEQDENPTALFSSLRREWLRGGLGDYEDADWRKVILAMTREQIAQAAARFLNISLCSRIRHLHE